jgi:hypothetical protein
MAPTQRRKPLQRGQGVAEADESRILAAPREFTDSVLLSEADDAAGALDALKSHIVKLISGIPVQVQVQRQHTITDIHADMNQLQVCIWRLKHMATSGGSGMRGSAQVTAGGESEERERRESEKRERGEKEGE